MFDIRQEVVRALAEAVQRGGRSLGSVPELLERVIEENMWQHRELGDREIQLSEFREFVALPYPEGLGTTIETLEALCRHEPSIMAFLAEAKRGKVGRPPKREQSEFEIDARGNMVQITDNVSNKNESKRAHDHGNSAESAYNRLRSEAYDKSGGVKNPTVANIHKRVIAGEISPHRGMVEAGFRRPTIAVNMKDVHSAANTLLNNMERDKLIELVQLLAEHLAGSE